MHALLEFFSKVNFQSPSWLWKAVEFGSQVRQSNGPREQPLRARVGFGGVHFRESDFDNGYVQLYGLVRSKEEEFQHLRYQRRCDSIKIAKFTAFFMRRT